MQFVHVAVAALKVVDRPSRGGNNMPHSLIDHSACNLLGLLIGTLMVVVLKMC